VHSEEAAINHQSWVKGGVPEKPGRSKGGETHPKGVDVSHPARSPKVITVESKWLQNCVAQYKPGESWRRERITFAGSWLSFLPETMAGGGPDIGIPSVATNTTNDAN